MARRCGQCERNMVSGGSRIVGFMQSAMLMSWTRRVGGEHSMAGC